jgi:hypothetical protein
MSEATPTSVPSPGDVDVLANFLNGKLSVTPDKILRAPAEDYERLFSELPLIVLQLFALAAIPDPTVALAMISPTSAAIMSEALPQLKEKFGDFFSKDSVREAMSSLAEEMGDESGVPSPGEATNEINGVYAEGAWTVNKSGCLPAQSVVFARDDKILLQSTMNWNDILYVIRRLSKILENDALVAADWKAKIDVQTCLDSLRGFLDHLQKIRTP